MGGGVGGGGGVGRGGVVGGLGGIGGLGLVLGVLGLTLVPHISDVARVAILNVVGHNLGTTVGKGNTVLAVGGIAVTGLVLVEVGASVVVGNGVGVLILGGDISVGGLLVGGPAIGGGGGGIGSRGGVVGSRGGGGDSHEGGSNEELKKEEIKSLVFRASNKRAKTEKNFLCEIELMRAVFLPSW